MGKERTCDPSLPPSVARLPPLPAPAGSFAHHRHGCKTKPRGAAHNQPLSTFQAGAFPSGSIFAPRSVQDLLVERSYLVSALSVQGIQSYELILRLSEAERDAASLTSGNREIGVVKPPPRQRRRLKKQIASLRARLRAAAEQEQAIIVRLGELYVEMQSRERWVQARFHLQQISESELGASPLLTATPVSEPTTTLIPVSASTALSPTSPIFVPMGSKDAYPSAPSGIPPRDATAC